MIKILILAPKENKKGGVAYYCKTLSKYLGNEHVVVNRGSRYSNESLLGKLFRLLSDYMVFLFKLVRENIDLVHQNTSLGRAGVVRDAVYILIAKLLGKRVLVFIRGWDEDYAVWIDNNPFSIFREVYKLADGYVVLANSFKKEMTEWGFSEDKIFSETTIVDDQLMVGFNFSEKKQRIEKSRKIRLLFLARVGKDKGIYETLDSFKILTQEKGYSNLSLSIAGDGEELGNAKSYAKENKLVEVNFHGYVRGENKLDLFKKSHIYLLPTDHGEGMPNSILEAMAFGLPVITRPRGGIPDFFENGEMGFMTQSKSPKDFADLIEKLLQDKDRLVNISEYNYNYAKEYFYASEVSKRIKNIYEKVLEENGLR